MEFAVLIGTEKKQIYTHNGVEEQLVPTDLIQVYLPEDEIFEIHIPDPDSGILFFKMYVLETPYSIHCLEIWDNMNLIFNSTGSGINPQFRKIKEVALQKLNPENQINFCIIGENVDGKTFSININLGHQTHFDELANGLRIFFTQLENTSILSENFNFHI